MFLEYYCYFNLNLLLQQTCHSKFFLDSCVISTNSVVWWGRSSLPFLVNKKKTRRVCFINGLGQYVWVKSNQSCPMSFINYSYWKYRKTKKLSFYHQCVVVTYLYLMDMLWWLVSPYLIVLLIHLQLSLRFSPPHFFILLAAMMAKETKNRYTKWYNWCWPLFFFYVLSVS